MVGSQRCSAALRSVLITLPQNSGAVAGLTTGLFRRILLITLATLQPTSIPVNSKFIRTSRGCRGHFNFNFGPFNVNLNFCAYRIYGEPYLTEIFRVLVCDLIALGILCIKFCTWARCCLDIIPLNFHARAHGFTSVRRTFTIPGGGVETDFSALFCRTNLSFVSTSTRNFLDNVYKVFVLTLKVYRLWLLR